MIKKLVTPANTSKKLKGVKIHDLNSPKRQALLFFHGAGLNIDAPLHLILGKELYQQYDIYLAGGSWSGFIAYDNGFRKPLGWAYHGIEETTNSFKTWINWVESNYTEVIVSGHSWGALLALHALVQMESRRNIALISPIPSMKNLLTTNFSEKLKSKEQWIASLQEVADNFLLTTDAPAPLPALSKKTVVQLLDSEINLSKLTEQYKGNMLVTIGSKEHPLLIQSIQKIVTNSPNVTLQQIQKAGHFYTKKEKKIAEAILAWQATIIT